MKTNRKLKKPDTSSSKLVLEEIIGLTTKNANGLASNTSTASSAYLAGCVVVIYNVDTSIQSHLMVSHRTPKPLNCVTMSKDSRFVAAAESGNQPAVLVWDCSTLAFVAELKGHLYGVECIAFSPDGEHLVSVGGFIYLWNWRSGMLVTKLKASSSSSAVTSVSFSSDAKFIVTAGKKHLKFWSVGSSQRTRLNKGTGSPAMHAKPVNLGSQKGSSFVSIASAILTKSSFANNEKVGDLLPIYALTDGGALCLVDCGLSVRKSVDLKAKRGFALSVSNKLIACACCNGIVQLFTSETLNCAGTLLYSKAKGSQGDTDIVCGMRAIDKDFHCVPTLPDAVACQFSTSEKLVVIYGDHTLYVWDIHDVKKATRCCMLVSHSACIWDVKNLCCENMHDPSLACVARGCSGGVSFATCSADGTIRLWDLALQPDLGGDDADNCSLNKEPKSVAHLVSAGIFEQNTVEAGINTQGFRSMATSSDGKYLGAGDSEGNLYIYNLHTCEYTCFQDVHDGEILSLSFSLSKKKYATSEEVMDGNYLLVSGGRDRIIHLYDVIRNFDLIKSIDDHSAAVTSVKLTCHGCKILSCSADRSLVFRDVSVTDSGYKISRRHHQMASHGTVYDMAVDPAMEFVVTVGQDKKINTYDIASGKLTRSFKPDKDFGDPIKVTMDPSYCYLVCSYSNKSMSIYDSTSGEMVTQTMGHGEVITGVIFLPDCKHLVSVGGDGCIFVWKLPPCMSSRILRRMKENYVPLSPKNLGLPVAFRQIMLSGEENQQCRIDPNDLLLLENSNQVAQKVLYQRTGPRRISTFRFSISRLPRWAQAKVASSNSALTNLDFTSSQPEQEVELKIFSPIVNDAEGCPSCTVVQALPSPDVKGSESCLSSLSRISPGTDISKSSPTPQEIGCFAMDKRWLNVYTVCLDVLTSPKVQHSTNLKNPISTSNLSEIPSDGDGDCSFGQADLVIGNQRGAASKSHNCSDFGFLGKYDQMTEQWHSCKSGSQIQEAMEVDASYVKFEDNDFFKQHFGSLSTPHKVEKSKSSIRRRYAARYMVRWDSPWGCKKLFDTPIHDLGGKMLNCRGEARLHVTSGNVAMQNLEEHKETNSCNQDPKNSTQSLPISSHALSQRESTTSTQADNSLNFKLAVAIDQKECIYEGSNLQQRITTCREALLNLDTTAENVLHSFLDLGSLVPRAEISNGHVAKLYDEAGDLLSSIAEKFNEVVKLVQCWNTKEQC